jgi:hypothetical protein
MRGVKGTGTNLNKTTINIVEIKKKKMIRFMILKAKLSIIQIKTKMNWALKLFTLFYETNVVNQNKVHYK